MERVLENEFIRSRADKIIEEIEKEIRLGAMYASKDVNVALSINALVRSKRELKDAYGDYIDTEDLLSYGEGKTFNTQMGQVLFISEEALNLAFQVFSEEGEGNTKAWPWFDKHNLPRSGDAKSRLIVAEHMKPTVILRRELVDGSLGSVDKRKFPHTGYAGHVLRENIVSIISTRQNDILNKFGFSEEMPDTKDMFSRYDHVGIDVLRLTEEASTIRGTCCADGDAVLKSFCKKFIRKNCSSFDEFKSRVVCP